MRRVVWILLFVVAPLCAQELLTAEEAVKIALENNYDIRLRANDLKIDSENVAIGNAGMLPAVTATVNDNNSRQYIRQVRSDGTINEVDNGLNNNLSYGVNLGWTVFDGLSMFSRYDQLKENRKLGEAELQLAILQRIGDVLETYYNLVQQQQQLTAIDTAIAYSRERLSLAENRFSIGKAARLDVLNAQVDLNTDLDSRLTQKALYARTLIELNTLLGRDPKTEFRVAETADVERGLLLPELEENARKQNPQLQAQLINKRISELNLRTIKGQRYPTISVNTGYNFSDTRSSLGFTTQNTNRGFNYGFAATLNVFDGFRQKRNETIAKIQIENATLAVQQQELAVLAAVDAAFKDYLTNLEMADLARENVAIAKRNFEITSDKFRIGTLTPVEVRTAQLNYLNAKVRLSNALYSAKLSELALRELSGTLRLR